MFFLGILYRLTSFLAVHKVLLAGLSTGVYFHTGVTVGVIGGACLVRLLLAVAAVREVDV